MTITSIYFQIRKICCKTHLLRCSRSSVTEKVKDEAVRSSVGDLLPSSRRRNRLMVAGIHGSWLVVTVVSDVYAG
ncbi:hypothetical protein PTKIN_Ptkin16aG0495700 [Pterospermum kingtungense]